MKTIIKTGFVFMLLFGVLFASNLSAQSAEEVNALMNEITQLMRNIEQKFNKIALEPEQLRGILQQLLKASQDGKPENLPESIKEYLYNNPTQLAKLIDPEADDKKIKELRKMIRNSLQTDDGLVLLIKKHPQILENLRKQEDILTEALKKYLKDENDLQTLFEMTDNEMKESEAKLKELIDIANKLQQKMNSEQKKKEEQEKEEEEKENGDKPQNPNDSKPNNSDPSEYQPDEGEEGNNKNNPTDRNAWDNPLPSKEYDRTREARGDSKPKGYEDYVNEYFKALSQFERRHEESNKENKENTEENKDNNEEKPKDK